MIELIIYRIRIGRFNVANKYIRLGKSKKCFRYSVFRDGRIISWIIFILSFVATNVWFGKLAEETSFFNKSIKVVKIFEHSNVLFGRRLDHRIGSTCQKVAAVNKFAFVMQISSYDCCQPIREENHRVKMETLDYNFLARYLNGNGQKKRGILNMHLNIRSLKYKVHEVKNIIKDHSPHILGLSECELIRENIEEKSLKIPGYDVLFPLSWQDAGYARILVYVKKNFKYRQIIDLQDTKIQSIWIQGGYHNSKDIIFGHIYREHMSDQSSSFQQAYMSQLLNQWDSAVEYGNPDQPNETHVCGDFNIDVYKEKWLDPNYSLINLSRLLKNMCDTNNFSQLVKDITRVQYDSVSQVTKVSCLDHIYTNAKHRCSGAVVTDFGDSDHDIISYTRFSKISSSPARIICKRNFKDFNSQNYLDDVKFIDWSDVYQCVDSGLAADCLTNKLNSVLDKHAPWVKIQQRKNFVPWLSTKTKELIKERDIWKRKAKLLAISSPEAVEEQCQAWSKYKKYRNQINNRKKREEILFKKEKLEEAMSSPDVLWKSAKSFMGWKSFGSPNQLSVNNCLITSAKEIAQVMNCFFVQKVSNFRKSMPNSPLDTTKIEECMRDKNCCLEIEYMSVSKVKKILKGLSNSKSTSLDGLNNFSVKLAAHYLASPLQHVISLSIIQQKFPESWKYSKVIPLYKKCDPLDRKNYRPVSLLSPLSKVLEKIVYEQLYEYFHVNKLFNENLHGYRKYRSTQTALLQLYDRWVRAASDGKLNGAVLLDLSAAFDLVDPSILLKKLELYNIDSKSLAWIKSYLSNRKQAVWVDHTFSDFLPCDIGVPQGSNLGPLLFLIFFNDLPRYLNCDIEAYADDSTLSISAKSVQEINQSLTENCAAVSKWMSQNMLKLNTAKTHIMMLGTSRRIKNQDEEIRVLMDGQLLEQSESGIESLLGCEFEPNLKWNQNIKSVLNKLKHRLAALGNLRYVVPYDVRKNMAEALFVSVLSYCLPLYGGTDKQNTESLQIMQNKAARFVTLASARESRKSMFDKLNWLTVKQLLFYHTALTTYRVRMSKEPEYLSSFLSCDNMRGNIIIPHTYLSLAKQSYCYRGATNWNQLPQCLRCLDTISKFKVELRKWIVENVEQF